MTNMDNNKGPYQFMIWTFSLELYDVIFGFKNILNKCF